MTNRQLERHLQFTQLLSQRTQSLSHFHTSIDHLHTKLDVHQLSILHLFTTPTHTTHTTRPRERLCSSIVHSPITTPSPTHSTLATQTFEPITHPFTPLPPAMTADEKPTRPRLYSTPLPTELHPGKFNARPSTTHPSTTHATTTPTTLDEASLWPILPPTVTVRSLLASSSMTRLAAELSDTCLISDPGDFVPLPSHSLELSFPFDPGGPG